MLHYRKEQLFYTFTPILTASQDLTENGTLLHCGIFELRDRGQVAEPLSASDSLPVSWVAWAGSCPRWKTGLGLMQSDGASTKAAGIKRKRKFQKSLKEGSEHWWV